MSTYRYRVIFDATLTGEFDLETSKERFSKMFKLSNNKTESLFSGKKVTVKKDISEQNALNLMLQIANAGGKCYLEKMHEEKETAVDRRQQAYDKRRKFRRGPRAGSIMQDRRLHIRRSPEKDQYEEQVLSKQNIPIAFDAYPRRIPKH
ncbi:MAG: hypothetical protein ACI92E_001563 [Oceanicoccus sp.]|jgi:hypothetical protein